MNEEEQSADLAYSLSVESYEQTLKQVDAMDARIQTLLALATTISLAFVAAVVDRGGLRFSSVWFAAACVVYIAGIVFGFVAQFRADVWQTSPKNLHANGWLDKPPATFKREFVYHAGEDFEKNRAMLATKRRRANYSALAFLVELGLLVLWVAVARG